MPTTGPRNLFLKRFVSDRKPVSHYQKFNPIRKGDVFASLSLDRDLVTSIWWAGPEETQSVFVV